MALGVVQVKGLKLFEFAKKLNMCGIVNFRAFDVNFGEVTFPDRLRYPRPQKISAFDGIHDVGSDRCQKKLKSKKDVSKQSEQGISLFRRRYAGSQCLRIRCISFVSPRPFFRLNSDCVSLQIGHGGLGNYSFIFLFLRGNCGAPIVNFSSYLKNLLYSAM